MEMNFLAYYVIFNNIITSKSGNVEVKVQQGLVIGTTQATVYEDKLYFAFYGVPYARPPLGKLRFKDPKPPKKWKKPFDARTEYHGACAQAHIVYKHALYGYEDCLHLNIYTPCLPNNGKECLKPVIVWIHGYAFTSSLSHIQGPDFLIDNDVLFISVTHRLGVLGFLKQNDADSNANMGLKDILMAIRWIRKNVKQFGGNKNKITLMGSGSAANFIALLMTTKHKKLFSKAILQSGSLYSPSIFQSDYRLERDRLLAKLKEVNIGSFANASTEQLVKLSQKIYTRKEIINFQRPVIPFTPLIENASNRSLITQQSHDIYRNLKAMDIRVPILIGFNTQGSISEAIPFLNNPHYLQHLNSFFKYMVPYTSGCKFNSSTKYYNTVASDIKNKYFKDGVSATSLQNFLRYASDLHAYPIYSFIKKLRLSVHKKLFVYKFNYSGKFNLVKAISLSEAKSAVKGAAEGDEICYILKCEPLWESYVNLTSTLYNRDRLLIKRIAEMWANFAKFGEPVRDYNGNVTWPSFTSKEDNVYVFGNEDKLLNVNLDQETSFWDGIYDKYYANAYCDNVRDEL